MTIDEYTNTIQTADALELLEQLPAESVHAVVTDPPYGLAFMGRDWDDFEPREYQQWCANWARRAKRVLKPGGHLLAFSGNRTHHRAFAGIEDAGFEIRDTLTWHYGSGFPKASDIGKTIDNRADAEREVVKEIDRGQRKTESALGKEKDTKDMFADGNTSQSYTVTEPATPEAEKWDGWKTGLKPATEYIVMARKPFDGATVDCVLEHGTGALNIEGCRVGTDGGHEHPGDEDNSTTETCYGDGLNGTQSEPVDKGRYPSNVVFDETAAAALDGEVGQTSGGDTRGVCDGERPGGFADVGADSGDGEPNGQVYEDTGGPSRYFYTSKASKSERTNGGEIANSHPTVKPTDLMEWLVTLVTRRDQIVLDPFAGSGTTCMAAKGKHRRFIGIEQQAQWADVARARCGLAPEDPSHVNDDDSQQALSDY